VIPRYQRVLFWVLTGSILLMALFLLRGCRQAREKLTRQRDQTPMAAPVATGSETFHLALANDSDGSIAMADRQIALPVETTTRMRGLLTRLIAEYSYKGSAHPLASGPAIDDVFLLDLPLRAAVGAGPGSLMGDANAERTVQSVGAGGQLAVINLHGDFADHHPSGVLVETLTIDSIVGTLYANFPRIEQVRFLVDGQPRETLNGHADLLRTYPVGDMTKQAAQGVAAGGQ
jgi:Sporulation and spore germination